MLLHKSSTLGSGNVALAQGTGKQGNLEEEYEEDHHTVESPQVLELLSVLRVQLAPVQDVVEGEGQVDRGHCVCYACSMESSGYKQHVEHQNVGQTLEVERLSHRVAS